MQPTSPFHPTMLDMVIPYRDSLISAQTGQTMLVTQENPGLAYVIQDFDELFTVETVDGDT